ncbi:MAG: hypothetical protein EHM47_09290 [Ignavibacteriales bacterium]|nr:MAG: hypothetical protein EHM47_09290 [Ignavibacteriales bacterium]
MSKKKKTSDKSSNLIPGISKTEKNKRAKYLSKRISSLYEDLSDWIYDYKDYSIKKNNVNVEGVKLPAIDIISGKKKVVTLNPAGLYSFGVNCQVDIKSEKEINILFDIAKASDPPDWQLISSEAGKKPKKLTKMVFRNLVRKQQE